VRFSEAQVSCHSFAMEPEIDPDAVVVDAMTAVANQIMSGTESVYDICMSVGSLFDPVLETAQWAGAAYVLWLWISDIQDDPRGVQDPKECERQGVLAASEWLANDHMANSVTAYFERWGSGGSAWTRTS
jgi:hypothetical protein